MPRLYAPRRHDFTPDAGHISQILCSGSNAALPLSLTLTLSVRDFGEWSVALVILSLPVAVSRAAVGENLLLVPGGLPIRIRTTLCLVLAVMGLPLVVGLMLAVLTERREIFYLACAGVCVAMQDSLRYQCFRMGDQIGAVIGDAAWVILFIPLLLVAFMSNVDPTILLSAWVLAGGVSLLILVKRCLGHELEAPDALQLHQIWPSLRSQSGSLVTDAVLGRGVAESMIGLCGAAGVPALAGSLRLAQIVAGPINTITSANRIRLTHMASSHDSLLPKDAGRSLVRTSGLLVIASLLVGCTALLVVLVLDFNALTLVTAATCCVFAGMLCDVVIAGWALRARLLTDTQLLVRKRVMYSLSILAWFAALLVVSRASWAAIAIPIGSLTGLVLWRGARSNA